MDIAGKAALITGGASGLGAAAARMILEAGGRAVIFDRNREAGFALARDLGEGARFVAGDVADPKDAQAAVDAAADSFGALHFTIQCAGVLAPGKLLEKDGPGSLSRFEQVIRVNLIGVFNVARLAAAAMIRNPPDAEGERGVIVNTASVAAFEGQIGQAAYAASKGGVVSMTLPLARELARSGIRVAAIAPGLFDTPMLAGLSGQARASLEAAVPFPPRLGRPREYAQLARQILENPMLNGAVIRLDGAIRMAAR